MNNEENKDGRDGSSADIQIYRMIPKNPPKGWKRNMGTIGWKGERLFIPAIATGMSDSQAMICLAHDGESFYLANGLILVPEEWARSEAPSRKETYDAIRKRALEMRERDPSIL